MFYVNADSGWGNPGKFHANKAILLNRWPLKDACALKI
jgi:hypothetical protein